PPGHHLLDHAVAGGRPGRLLAAPRRLRRAGVLRSPPRPLEGAARDADGHGRVDSILGPGASDPARLRADALSPGGRPQLLRRLRGCRARLSRAERPARRAPSSRTSAAVGGPYDTAERDRKSVV